MSADPIISATALAALSDVILVDCRPDESAYRKGHLPGAVHAQLERDLSAHTENPERGGRHPLPSVRDFAIKLGRLGITPSSHVVAYDEQQGANAAGRFWWMLRALGHERVQVLDGGLPALLAAGYQLTDEPPAVIAEAAYQALAPEWTRAQAGIADVERARQLSDHRVIDVRAAFRFRGESEPIDPIAGHIPGAHNIPLTDNLQQDGTFKSRDDLQHFYTAALGGIPVSQVIVHCGSGVTACHTLLALERAGLDGAKLYVGSWSEWCRNADRPREPS